MDTARPTGTEHSVAVEFTLTEDELVRCLRSRLRSRVAVVIAPVTGVVCVAFALLVVAAGRHRFWAFYLLALAALEFWRTARIMSGPHRIWRTSVSLRSPQWMAFSDAGVETRTALGESRLRWDYFGSTMEHDGCYVLQAAGRPAYHVVPRRAFANVDDELVARRLFTLHTQAQLRGLG